MTALLDHDGQRLDVSRRALGSSSPAIFALAAMLRQLDGNGSAATAVVERAVTR